MGARQLAPRADIERLSDRSLLAIDSEPGHVLRGDRAVVGEVQILQRDQHRRRRGVV